LTAAGLGGVAALAFARFRRGQAQEEAQLEAVRDRRRFLQRLDHELKNPLTAIRAGLALMPSNGETAALSSVEAQVRRMSRLTADLRKLAELESRPIERGTVDLSSVLGQVFELAQERPEAADRRLTLTLPQAPWPLPTISGDFDLLVLVAHNLVDNAMKFTRPGDTLEVRAFEDGASVVVEVADTGPGIPDDELPHVWEELYRGSSGHAVPGSGLGLALARAIILRHGGHVVLRSRAGQGTVVTVRLPLKAA
jgi:two-component system OmpR family sensor kinase